MRVQDQILYPALRLAGVLGAAGRGASPSQLADAFASLNRMMDSWTIQNLLIYTIRSDRYTLTPSQVSYTIGPVGADFTAPRPVEITQANIVLAGSPAVHCPLKLIDDQEWASISVREIPTTLPLKLYNDGAYPNSRLYFWPYPTAANDLELFTSSQLTRFAKQTDDVSFPPGYEDALVYNLAVRLSGQFGTVLRGDVAATAKEGKALVKSRNSAAPRLITEPPSGARRAYRTYRSGQ